ncbi:TNFAIP3-interacting protein 2 isoform X1 [Gouania willdenowi]|uniref:TNFAIP3-interacting protein 2 isoform X1 n=1 Tax=Gouania willdenowi TaxID=441366 RepID=UPI001054A41C|nr:TNFAIP3-interacting protein 2 isoform X1 [Gouania willdenowi]
MESVSVPADEDRMRSFNVLNTLYHETRQELELLNKQLTVKDSIIADLKARLGRHERVYLTVGDCESALVGPSNSLVESLLLEICKLRQRSKEVDCKTAKQAEEIQRLNMKLKEKELELESVRCQPDHEKDLEIQRLRSALEERERTEATRSVLCTSLAEEAEQLRGQLRATVKVCKELLARLEKKGRNVGAEGEELSLQQKDKEVRKNDSAICCCCASLSVFVLTFSLLIDPQTSPDVSALNGQICQLKKENQQLKQRVTYVQGLNCQWQKYDSSREDYIRGLCQRLKETTGEGLLPALSSVSAGLLHQEINRLNGLLKEKMSECVRLNREVEEIRRNDKERIQTLEQQVLIYTDDFRSERADRERAQGQIDDLKEQLSHLKQQLHKQGASRESRDLVPVCRVHIGHRIASRRSKDTSEPLLRTSAERKKQQQQQPPPAQPAAPPAAPPAAAASLNSIWNDSPLRSELQCPRCLARFNDSDAAEYLNHCEECARL